MPQYIIKLTTYDPAVLNALERLRRCRKQAAFTLEALRFFVSSETGAKVLQLITQETSASPSSTTPSVTLIDQNEEASPAQFQSQNTSIESPQDDFSCIIKKIMA